MAVVRKPRLLYPMLLLICSTGLVAVGTFALIRTAAQQYLAGGYSAVQGKIVRSEVGQGAILQRGIEIEYNYAVDGKNYTGHRYRYDDHNSALEWTATVEKNPRWSLTTVYYNPADPADSLLLPGVDGCDLLLLLLTLPLNVLGFLLWSALVARMRETSGKQSAGGVRILKHLGETRISLGESPALTSAIYAAAATAFVAAFPVVITGGFAPRLSVMKITWGAVFAVGIGVFAWRVLRNRSGIYDLRIDQTSRMITLPRLAGRRQLLSIARSEISGVSLQRRVSKSPSGIHFSYLPALNHRGGQAIPQPIKLISWGWSEEKARSFSQWLSQELGVEFKGVEDESPIAP